MPLLINQQSMKRMMMNGRWPNDSSIITWARPWLRWRYLSKTSKQLTQNFLQQQTMTTVSQSIITLSRLQSMSIIYIAPIVEGWVWGAGVWVTRRDRQKRQESPAIADKPARRESLPKLLQFGVPTTLSLTILAYLHAFNCYCVRNLRNPEKFTDNSNLWSSRSSKVTDLGANRKPICDLLLVINSNFSRICYRFRDIHG